MTPTSAARPADDVVLGLLADGAAIGKGSGRSELPKALDIAAARIRRPATVVCVVGEYKQGKSHLINALVGHEICPVDDDLATAAITVIGYGERRGAVVRRHVDGEPIVEEIALDDVSRFAAETGSEDSGAVDMVEIALPSPLLDRGLAIVDTPGVNAFRPGDERAVLDFLPYADGLILVTDASTELSPLELRFLGAARQACPTVLVALSKVDLYPEWRRIADLDRAHLAEVGIPHALIPLSSTLRAVAVAEDDPDLAEESGFAVLLDALDEQVLARVRQLNRDRALGELDRIVTELRSVETTRLEALEDPDAAEQPLRELRRAEEAVARLREASAKWQVVLNDGISDLRSDLDHRLRTAVRELAQEADRRLTDEDPSTAWDTTIGDLKSSLGGLGQEAFDAVRAGTVDIGDRIGEMIAEDVPDWPLHGDAAIDVEALWSASDREVRAEGTSTLTSGLSVLRGGYSGMLMLGMLAQVAGIALLGPLSLGAGALFGARQYRDERKRQMERHRQQARTVLRQFLDQAYIELSTRTQRAVQDAHRSLRDHYSERIRRLSATYANAVRVLEESRDADQARRAQLTAATRQRLDAIDQLAGRMAALATGVDP